MSRKRATDTDLAPRVIPVQERAKATVGLILDTTAALLDEVGVDAFTTNLLAERAAIRVRTIYRYFPNKLAVITALARRVMELEAAALRFEPLADTRIAWRDAVDRISVAYSAAIEDLPGLAVIRRTVAAVPDLRRLDNEFNEALAADLARALAARGVRLPTTRLFAMGRLVIETATTIRDHARTEGRAYGDELVDEMRLMIRSYLANYLD